MTAVWAHRGASSRLPENTVPAFLAAMVVGAEGIEMDVQLTSDGHVVVCHDETIDRTSDGTGSIADLTLEQLRARSFARSRPGWGFAAIPELDDVLALVAHGRATLNIELKNAVIRYEGLEERVVEAVRRHRMTNRVVLSSFNHRSLRRLAELAPDIRRAMLYSDDLADPWDYAISLGVQAVHPQVGLVLGRDEIPTFHAAGLGVRVWTVDDPDLARAARDAGADAVITNDPAAIRVALAS